jgi:hypothetical protein
MRVYIIGNDGITLWRTAPAKVNNGEIAVAANEELHAAPLSAKRLLALWNALPGVEKRRKGDSWSISIGDSRWGVGSVLLSVSASPDGVLSFAGARRGSFHASPRIYDQRSRRGAAPP